ncbi:MAG: hypothetical protein ABJF11_03550 [Reichenbachiella sp.]|uniref:hypothetical protein n=1 Tax=Reichenbachiella sp. TaxID=2184521 RepID=UPI003263E03A
MKIWTSISDLKNHLSGSLDIDQQLSDLQNSAEQSSRKFKLTSYGVLVALLVLLFAFGFYSWPLNDTGSKAKIEIVTGLIAFLLAFWNFMNSSNWVKVNIDSLEKMLEKKIVGDSRSRLIQRIKKGAPDISKWVPLIMGIGLLLITIGKNINQ